MKPIVITDFLTPAQINMAKKCKTAMEVCEKVIKPNMAGLSRRCTSRPPRGPGSGSSIMWPFTSLRAIADGDKLEQFEGGE